MIYLAIFWISIFLFILLYLSSRFFHLLGLVSFIDQYAGLYFIVFAFPLVIMAILTNDPVNFVGIDIPMEFQWIGSLLVSGFGAWKFYLHPLKHKVYRMDRELGETKMGIELVRSDLALIKESLMYRKIRKIS